MTRFKEALNELRGKYAAKRAKAYQDQHRGERPVRGTPDQEKAFKKALGGKYNDTVLAASQGKIKKPGGETVTADYAAETFRKAGKRAVNIGKRAVARAKKRTPKPTYGRRPDGSRMSTGQGGRGDTRSSIPDSTTILGDALVEALKERCWKGYEPTPGKKAYSKGSCKPKGRKRRKDETGEGIGVRPSKGDTTGVAKGDKPITPEERAQALKNDQSKKAKARRLAKAKEIANRRKNK